MQTLSFKRSMRRPILAMFACLWMWGFSHCTNDDAEDIFGVPPLWLLGPNRLSVYYTDPGSDEQSAVDKKVDVELIKLIDKAEKSVDIAVYNLGRDSVIDALIRAKEDRDIEIRMVGDVDEVVTNGYRSILRTDIPFSLGNSSAIQHNKFAVIDDNYLFMGTGNMTNSGFLRNNNNYLIIENPQMAKHYKQEFRQMYYGRYGSKKIPFTFPGRFRTNFTDMEVYFSPYEGQDAMDKLIGLVNSAQRSVKFMIFAHTHDELAVAMIRAAKRGVIVEGVHDKTFIRGTSMEAPRLYSAGQHQFGGPRVRVDGNEFTAVAGVSAHGGKLHTKTLIVDDVVTSTGSFNWSTNAVENNDENMVVVYNQLISQEIVTQWQRIWELSKPMHTQLDHSSGDVASYGDVVISELNWAGSYKSAEYKSDDDWIELKNTTNRDIDLSHWSLTWDSIESKNYPIPDEFTWYKPSVATRHLSLGRLVIPAGRYFLIKAQNGAIASYDNKISGTKDFSLNDSILNVRLYDVAMNLVDEAGDGSPPFAGRVDSTNKVAYSMERFFYASGKALPGKSAGSWYTSNGNNQTGSNLIGLGQIDNAYSVCSDFAGNAQQCTIGTPNFSGNISSIVDPSTATGGENNLTNIPVAAWSTATSSAVVQMRWAVNAAPTIAGTPCPCTASYNSSDPSLLSITTQPQTAGSTYNLTVNSVADITGGTSTAGVISFEGHGNPQAQVQIVRVYPASSPSVSEDVVILKALTSGTLHNLGIYYYDYQAPSPALLYKMKDVPITAGQYIQVAMDKQSGDVSNDSDYGATPTFDIAKAGALVSGFGGLTSANTWQVFSPLSGIASTDGIIMASYDLNALPMDVMCYSNQDGDVPFSLMAWGFRTLFRMPSVYNLGNQLPVDEVNDSLIQSYCSSFAGGGSNDYLERTQDTNNGSDFTLY